MSRDEVVDGAQPSTWRTTPAGLVRLLLGLALFGAGEAMVVRSELGNTPWTVLAEGLSQRSPFSIGVVTILIGLVVLLGWFPLRERPGTGTVLNVLAVGVFLDVTLALLPALAGLPSRGAALLVGIVLIGLGSGLYLGERLGPGPRDGLMTGIQRRTGVNFWIIRACIEVGVLVVGALLGGTVGIGTLAFALLVGPAVNAGLWLRGDDRVRRPRTAPLGPGDAPPPSGDAPPGPLENDRA